MTTNFRKRVFGVASALASMFLITNASAQDYPSRTITLISPWPAGGPADAIGRPLADALTEALGQTVVFENHPGANGTIATNLVAEAKPDGYTLLLSHVGPTAISAAVQKELPYDPIEDFEHIARVASGPMLLVANADLPVESMQEFLDYAKENPDLTYGSVGIGSTTHLATELLKMKTGVDLRHIPYAGAAPNITDMLGGRLDVTVLGIGALLPHIESGAVRPLGVTSTERSPLVPDVPSISDVVPGYDVSTWYGLAAPAGTPQEIVDRISQETNKILQQPEISKSIELGSGMAAVPDSSPEEHANKIKQEIDQWQALVESAGIEPQ